MKAVFVLESGIAPDTGSLNYGDRLFGRQAYVGINGNYGALSLARRYAMTFYALLEADILGPNIYAMGNLDITCRMRAATIRWATLANPARFPMVRLIALDGTPARPESRKPPTARENCPVIIRGIVRPLAGIRV
jgi:hypothetical protein